MGTRSDFYIGRDVAAMEWIGSFALDGYPEGVGDAILHATTATAFRHAVEESGRRDLTLPAQGWPWPWDDSTTTDYAYAFEASEDGASGKVYASCFGSPWFDPLLPEPDVEGELKMPFPDMPARQQVTYGPRSGLILIDMPREG